MVPVFPAVSVNRTLRVSLAVSVTPLNENVFCPTEVVAVLQVLPLLIDTSTISPATMFALVVPEIVCAAVFVMKSVDDEPVSAENATVATVVEGAVVSSTYAWLAEVPALPAVSVNRTIKVLLDARVTPLTDQVFCPTVVVAVLQVLPLSRDTSTVSPATMLALVVPEIVCAAVLVMKSVEELPVSAENAVVAMVAVGAVVSIVTVKPADAALVLEAASVALAVSVCEPWLNVLLVIDQMPLPLAVALPSSVVPSVSYNLTVEFGSAVPVNVPVVMLVMLSVEELPLSLPEVRSGVPGGEGAVVSAGSGSGVGRASAGSNRLSA